MVRVRRNALRGAKGCGLWALGTGHWARRPRVQKSHQGSSRQRSGLGVRGSREKAIPSRLSRTGRLLLFQSSSRLAFSNFHFSSFSRVVVVSSRLVSSFTLSTVRVWHACGRRVPFPFPRDVDGPAPASGPRRDLARRPSLFLFPGGRACGEGARAKRRRGASSAAARERGRPALSLRPSREPSARPSAVGSWSFRLARRWSSGEWRVRSAQCSSSGDAIR